MEGPTGVDVSWLHHSHKDTSRSNSVVSTNGDLSPKASVTDLKGSFSSSSSTAKMDSSTAPQHHHHLLPPHHAHRSHLFKGASSEDRRSNSVSSASLSPPPSSPPQRNASFSSPSSTPPSTSSTSTGRRGSWISSLQSKFSSSSSSATSSPTPPTPAAASSSPAATTTASQPPATSDTSTSEPHPPPHRRSSTMILPPAAPVVDDTAPYVPSPPATKQPGFLQSALRRLSSTSVQQMGKANGNSTGGLVERKVMNVDPNRERCRVQELDAAKLRRVSFCVDVEIAAPPKYRDDGPSLESTTTTPPPTLSSKKSGKDKSKKMKEKGEGEALKNPKTVAEEKEKEGVVKVEGKEVEAIVTEEQPKGAAATPEGRTSSDKKREKKKRSEEERKERKEKKRRQAEQNGKIPMELTRESPVSSPDGGSSPGASTPACQDRPTTDPVRIYRRCCQLRESKVMINIVDQLSQPSVCAAATPGIVSTLDLSGITIPLVNLVTLGDFLAVVPVKKVLLENCSLGDEGIRVVLAGLLSARTPEANQSQPFTHLAGATLDRMPEQYGAVEKLVLKNNKNLTKEGWKHICLFLHMTHSLKAIDLSGIPFPSSSITENGASPVVKTSSGKSMAPDILTLFRKAMSERLAGSRLEELVMSECDLTAEHIGGVVDGVIASGLRRLGIANNHLSAEGMAHICRFIKEGHCEGLDLGGNDLGALQPQLISFLGSDTPLYALSLADCALSVPALADLLPALLRLPNFRFIDLSHNHALFAEPSALSLLRKYLPRFPLLKRIHLCDVGMTPDDAIALAEVLPECPVLAHLNILENPAITKLVSSAASNETSQEEASALYASLMAAVRVSRSIVAVDIDVPSPSSSEVVKALAKQVIAYSLRNLEQGVLPEVVVAADETPQHHHYNTSGVHIPDVLMHLVGHSDDSPENHDADPPAPDEDYVIGGTGVVKALGVCLQRRAPTTTTTGSGSNAGSGAATPSAAPVDGEGGKAKAKIMSANLLDSARKIRARLQPALVREAKGGDEMNLKKLIFLDQTLSGVIRRFEDEYPETRLPEAKPSPPQDSQVQPTASLTTTTTATDAAADITTATTTTTTAAAIDENDDDDNPPSSMHPPLSRHDSDVSLASRAMGQEEGRMHRFGQTLRRELLRPQTEDHVHHTTGTEEEDEDILELRKRLEGLEGREILERVEEQGHGAAMRELEGLRGEIRKERREGGGTPRGEEGERVGK